jgi:hypothetical protein
MTGHVEPPAAAPLRLSSHGAGAGASPWRSRGIRAIAPHVIPNATFDTHAAVKALTGAGLGEREAEAITDTVREAVAGGVATKVDLAGLEVRMTVRLYGGLIAVVVANTGLTVALLKLL